MDIVGLQGLSSRQHGRSRGERVTSDGRDLGKQIALIALVVLVLLGPIMTFGGFNLTDEGTVERQVGYLAILTLTLFAVWPNATRLSLIAMPIPVLVAFGWCILSLSWAIDPPSAVRRLILTLTVAWTVFLLVRHSRTDLVIDVLRWCLVGAILVSYLVVVVDPATGIHPMADSAIATATAGEWRGMLGNKNFAGAVCALCIIFFLFDAKRFHLYVRIGVIVIAAFFLFRTGSKTSAGMLALALVCGVLFQMLGRRLRSFIIPIAMVFGSLTWMMGSAYKDLIRANLLDPRAFTGRGQIWSALLRYSSDHPMTGAGFGSFWNIGPSSPVFMYGRGFVTTISVGHSGYVDSLITVGIPGLILMIVAVMVMPTIKLLSRTDLSEARGGLIAALLLFCIGHNTTETGLFERDAIVSTFLFIAAALAYYSDGRRRARPSTRSGGDELMAMLRTRQASA